jgi:hypothetical protein
VEPARQQPRGAVDDGQRTIGEYREDQLANLAFHRWAVDASLAATWHDPKAGWDVSGKVGVTFNGTNRLHRLQDRHRGALRGLGRADLLAAVLGRLQAYHFEPAVGDSGAGAVLGPEQGPGHRARRDRGLQLPARQDAATVRARVFEEFDASAAEAPRAC